MRRIIMAALIALAVASVAKAESINKVDVAFLVEEIGLPWVEAQKIVDYRKIIGHFTSFDQLYDVPGLDPDVIEQIRDDAGLTIED